MDLARLKTGSWFLWRASFQIRDWFLQWIELIIHCLSASIKYIEILGQNKLIYANSNLEKTNLGNINTAIDFGNTFLSIS